MTPATPAVCSPLGHASPESNVGRQAFSAPTRLILGPSQSPNPRTLTLIPPFYQSQPVICAVHVTEPCFAEPHVAPAGPAVSGAYVFRVDFVEAQPITVYQFFRGGLHLPPRGPWNLHCHRGCSAPSRWKAGMMLVLAGAVKGSRPGQP